jgi:hypothetical protein
MKRPAFQFYPGDWQRDAALRACSVAARGLWIEMMCVMHQAEPYGYLVLNEKSVDSAQLARMVGSSDRDVRRWLGELNIAGAYSVDGEGHIFSRRMVRDERLRNIRADAGKLGGNPVLLGGKVNQAPNLRPRTKVKPSPTPSSSVFSLQSSKAAAASSGDKSTSAPPTKKHAAAASPGNGFFYPEKLTHAERREAVKVLNGHPRAQFMLDELAGAMASKGGVGKPIAMLAYFKKQETAGTMAYSHASKVQAARELAQVESELAAAGKSDVLPPRSAPAKTAAAGDGSRRRLPRANQGAAREVDAAGAGG